MFLSKVLSNSTFFKALSYTKNYNNNLKNYLRQPLFCFGIHTCFRQTFQIRASDRYLSAPFFPICTTSKMRWHTKGVHSMFLQKTKFRVYGRVWWWGGGKQNAHYVQRTIGYLYRMCKSAFVNSSLNNLDLAVRGGKVWENLYMSDRAT